MPLVRHALRSLTAAAMAAIPLLGNPSPGSVRPERGPATAGEPPAPPPPVQFVDVTEESGIDFHHVNGASGQRYFPETMGVGVCFFDYDGDQDLDLYFMNGAAFPGYAGPPDPANALFRNDSGVFVETAADAGVDHPGHGMGCAAADFDNDGDTDLYLTNYGPNALYRNEGNGRYTDFTAWAAVGDTSWSMGSAFLDYDNDGDLDLYVANYVHYDLAYAEQDMEPYLAMSQRAPEEKISAYPHPRNFAGAEDFLFRNDGEGRFRQVNRLAGLVDTSSAAGRGLGVVATDYNSDGWPDLYVANDAVPNFLYRNEGDGRFTEIGQLAGVAYGQDGQQEAGMGVDAADYDGDGNIDLVVTNFDKEPIGLYRNKGMGFFPHASFSTGIGLISLRYLSFGIGFIDYDNDGYQDLFVANGHVLDNIHLLDRSATYEQQNLLLRNEGPDARGRHRFRNVSPEAGPGLALRHVSRGCAFGDYDEDGDVDVVVANISHAPVLLRNEGGNRRNWLSVGVRGGPSNRDGIGARITVWTGGCGQVREVRGSFSYLSQRELRVCFGLGDRTRVDSVEVRWPGGGTERRRDVEANQFITLVEGKVGREQPDTDP